jgi:hypothetical protein
LPSPKGEENNSGNKEDPMISRGKVKTPEAPPHTVVSQLFAAEG